MSNGVTVGGQPGRFRATLTLRGQELDPTAISEAVDCDPDRSHRRGDKRKSGTAYREGMWSITAVTDGDEKPSALLDRLLLRPTSTPAVWQNLSRTLEITLGIYALLTTDNQDFLLSPSQVGLLAMMGAQLWVDMYVDENDG